MRICIDLTSLYDKLSGIEKFTLMISKNMILEDQNNSYHLIFWNEIHSEFLEICKMRNVTHSIISTKNKLLMSQVSLPLELQKNKADTYLFMAFPSPLAFRSKKIINVVHDMTPWLYPETMSKKGLILFRSLISNAMSISKSIVTVSNASKKDLLNKFSYNGNIDVVYNGVDSIFTEFIFSEEENNSIKEKYKLPDTYILSLGTLEPRKNFKLLLDSYVELKKSNSIDLKLVIVGRKGWKYDQLFEGMDEEIQKNIIFTGFVDTEELPYIYKNAQVFVFPSLYEGFGIPIIEAGAMETIVLASDIEASKEVLGEQGILFKSNDKDQLKKKLLEVLSLDNESKAKAELYLKENSKKYNWQREAKKMIKIVERK